MSALESVSVSFSVSVCMLCISVNMCLVCVVDVCNHVCLCVFLCIHHPECVSGSLCLSCICNFA